MGLFEYDFGQEDPFWFLFTEQIFIKSPLSVYFRHLSTPGNKISKVLCPEGICVVVGLLTQRDLCLQRI